jgi:hypothetical protein
MLRPKVTGLFVELSEFGMLAIKTSSLVPPFEIQAVYESPLLDIAGTQAFIRAITEAHHNQLSAANCVFYPRKRFLCKAELENPMKGRDDPNYFKTLLRDKFRIETENQNILVINPHDGYEFGLPPLPKEVLFCGAPSAEMQLWQNTFIDCALYPERMEMGTLSGIGAFLDYCAFAKIPTPTLWIELSSEGMTALIFRNNKIDNVRFIPLGLDHFLATLQSHLNLADLASARAALMAGNFNVNEIAPLILAPLIKDLQSFISFYELQFTTQLKHIVFTLLPQKLDWLSQFISKSLSIEPLQVNYEAWLSSKGIQGSGLAKLKGSQWLNLCGLMVDHSPQSYA